MILGKIIEKKILSVTGVSHRKTTIPNESGIRKPKKRKQTK